LVKNRFKLIVQCRIGSLRLPGKVLFNFYQETVFDRILKIAKKIAKKKDIIFLLGEKNVCSVLGDKCDKHGVNYEYCNKGYEDDLYSRYKVYLSKLNKSYDFFIRMTADNYLIQPLVVKKMIKDFISNKWDYSYVKPLSHYACEIVKIDSFLNNLDYNRENLEHITPSFRNKKKKFKIKSYNQNFYKIDHTKSITLDTIKDLIFLKKIEAARLCKKIDCIPHIKKIEKWKKA
tara:strand:+ start:2125 stop:2820 length:696 start_codon:yes stop_codon:yes gene_type:complete